MKIPGLILVLLFSSIISLAQVERVPAKQADSVINKSAVNTKDKPGKKDLVKELDLSREQKIKIKEIRQSGKAKKDAIENNDQLSASEKKTQLREQQKEQAKNIQAILTEEQKEKFKTKRQEARKEKN